MKVFLTRNTAVKGQHLGAGEVHEVTDADAAFLIRQGKATEAIEAPACPPIKPKVKKLRVVEDNGA
jgi:hypothetical protein